MRQPQGIIQRAVDIGGILVVAPRRIQLMLISLQAPHLDQRLRQCRRVSALAGCCDSVFKTSPRIRDAMLSARLKPPV